MSRFESIDDEDTRPRTRAAQTKKTSEKMPPSWKFTMSDISVTDSNLYFSTEEAAE
jgi:hypothetical protein